MKYQDFQVCRGSTTPEGVVETPPRIISSLPIMLAGGMLVMSVILAGCTRTRKLADDILNKIPVVTSSSMFRTAEGNRIKADFRTIEDAFQFFHMDTQRYPNDLGQLLTSGKIKGWNGPYLKNRPVDPWNRPYIYNYIGDPAKPYEIRTLGADGKEGGAGENKDYSNLDYHLTGKE